MSLKLFSKSVMTAEPSSSWQAPNAMQPQWPEFGFLRCRGQPTICQWRYVYAITSPGDIQRMPTWEKCSLWPVERQEPSVCSWHCYDTAENLTSHVAPPPSCFGPWSYHYPMGSDLPASFSFKKPLKVSVWKVILDLDWLSSGRSLNLVHLGEQRRGFGNPKASTASCLTFFLLTFFFLSYPARLRWVK